MKKLFLTFGVLSSLVLFGAGPLWAQSGRYVKAATLQLSVGDWTDVYLNGHEIVDQDPNMSKSKGYVTVELTTDQLCYFVEANCLGLEYSETVERRSDSDETDVTGDTLGVAYVLNITFSDNTSVMITSSDNGKHLNYHNGDKTVANPSGWADPDFDDSAWAPAKISAPSMSLAVTLIDPQTHKPASYLSTFKNDAMLVTHVGERWLFRQTFPLEVVNPPGCIQPRQKPKPTPKVQPTATPVPPRPTFTPVPPRPTFTPIPPRPTKTPTPYIPTPTSTPIPIVRHKAPPKIPTPTPIVIWTSTPTRVFHYRPRPTATPLPLPPAPTATPIRRYRPKPTRVPARVIPTATRIPQTAAALTMPETIVFVNPPVNIDVSFADGPGEYKLEIVDGQGNHVNTLYDKHVGYEKESWLSWDGKNDQGRLLPYGQYYALFSKDGTLIRRIALSWIPPDQQ